MSKPPFLLPPGALLPPRGPLDLTIGAALIGFAVTLFLYGVALGQVIAFFRKYGQGRTGCGTRCLVTALWSLNTLHVALASYVLFAYSVLSHGDPLALFPLVWVTGVVFMVIEGPMALVRLGYLYRMWRLTKMRKAAPIFASLAMVSLVITALGLYFGSLVEIGHGLESRWPLYLALSLQILVDGSIAIAVLVLLQQYNTGIRSLDIIMKAITLYIMNTGALSVLITFLGIVLFTVLPHSFIFVGLYWVLAQLHSCSFLAVLNAETELMEQTAAHAAGNAPQFTTAIEVEEPRPSSHSATFDPSELSRSSGWASRGGTGPYTAGGGESQRVCDPGKESLPLE